MKSQKIEGLFEIARRAKAAKLFAIANVVFAVIFRELQARFAGEDQNDDLGWVEYLSSDLKGVRAEEVYYDVVTVSYEVSTLTIPEPLLNRHASMCALKLAFHGGMVGQREQGIHEYHEAASEQESLLWRALFALVPAITCKEAADMFLEETPDITELVEEDSCGANKWLLRKLDGTFEGMNFRNPSAACEWASENLGAGVEVVPFYDKTGVGEVFAVTILIENVAQKPPIGKVRVLHCAVEDGGNCIRCGKEMAQWAEGEDCPQ